MKKLSFIIAVNRRRGSCLTNQIMVSKIAKLEKNIPVCETRTGAKENKNHQYLLACRTGRFVYWKGNNGFL